MEVGPDFGKGHTGGWETGADTSGAYVEFDMPPELQPTFGKSTTRRTGVIPTDMPTTPLPIGHLNPTYVPEPWGVKFRGRQ